MIGNRRTQSSYSLDRAIDWSRELNRPLIILEALRCGYHWATDRVFPRAHNFRRYLHKNPKPGLTRQPRWQPLRGLDLPVLSELPSRIVRTWPIANLKQHKNTTSKAKVKNYIHRYNSPTTT